MNRRFSDCIATMPDFSEGTPEDEMEIETGKEILRNWIHIARYWMPDRDVRAVLTAAADMFD